MELAKIAYKQQRCLLIRASSQDQPVDQAILAVMSAPLARDDLEYSCFLAADNPAVAAALGHRLACTRSVIHLAVYDEGADGYVVVHSAGGRDWRLGQVIPPTDLIPI